MPIGISNLASLYAAGRRAPSKPGRPSINRDPIAPGVRAGAPVKGGVKATLKGNSARAKAKAAAFVGGKGPNKAFAGRGAVRS